MWLLHYIASFDVKDTYVVAETLEWGLEADESLDDSRPLTSIPDEINDIFDDIVYEKGAGMLRMLSALLGGDILQQALQTYLRQHQFASVNREHLWTVLTEVC